MRVYDFPSKELGRVTPYGVYDLAANDGWVSVGIDHDTAAFAVATIRRWWAQVGRARYPHSDAAADHGRWGRQQRVAHPAVEAGVAAAGGRDRAGDHGLPLPTGHQQVEQDRAPALRLHHPELAWTAAAELRGDPQPDRQHHAPTPG